MNYKLAGCNNYVEYLQALPNPAPIYVYYTCS